tara:strand:+ start:11458 stop:12666 length:1209 start_codon:yes stop_codon:yes gene_type:complete
MAAAFLQFLATVWIARTLGEERSGDFFFWSAILMSFGHVATFGLDGLALQQVPRLDGNRVAHAHFLGVVRTIAITFSAFVGAVLIGYALLAQKEISRSLLWYCMLPIGIGGMAMCRVNGESMKGGGYPLLAILYRQFVAGFIFLLAIVVLGKGLTAGNALVCYSVAFFVTGFLAPFGPGFSKLGLPFHIPEAKEVVEKLRAGVPIFSSTIFTALTYVIPLAVLESMFPAESVSFLTTAYRLFMLFDLLAAAIHSVAMPRLSRSGHAKDWALTAQIYRGSIVNGLKVLGVPLVLVLLFASPVMRLFGPGFAEAAPILQTFLAFTVVSLVLGPANELVLMMGHTKRMAMFSMVRTVTTILLSFAFIPVFGPLGMALAVGVGLLLQKGLCLGHFFRNSRNSGNAA